MFCPTNTSHLSHRYITVISHIPHVYRKVISQIPDSDDVTDTSQ